MKWVAGASEAGPAPADAALVEAALGAPAAFYQFRLSPSGAYAIPFVSPDFVGRYGIEQGEPEETAARFFSRIHPDDLTRIHHAIARSARTLETFQGEFRFRLASGAEVWVEARSNPRPMPDGGVLWNGITTDITARMNAEAALRESEGRLRLFVRHAPVALAMFDRDMRYITASRRWLTDYRLGDLDLTGLSHYEVFPEIPDRWKAVHQRGLAGEVIRTESDRFERADGSVQWLRWEIWPWQTDAQDVGGILIFTEDITERKKAAEALEASEARYRVLFENAAEGIIAIAPDTGRFQFFNPALCAMFGYTSEEFGRLTIADIHPKAALADVLEGIRATAAGTPPTSSGVPCLRKDGTAFVADVRGSVVELEGRKVVFALFTDVTERVRLEERLRQAQKMDAIGQLAGGVAHDFNNLLTVISGNIELLLSDARAEGPKRGALTDIRTASERAASLTRQLLAFSRKQILEPRLVDVHVVLAGIEKMLRRLIGEDVELATDLAADPSWVKVDPGQLEQVVMNLALNARDAMPRGGRITIRTRNLDPSVSIDPEETAGQRLRPKLAISISDTGGGIPPEVRAHLFEPFFTTKAFGKGTGLGLATVYGIVRQSGGDITVESEPGNGATFTVVLPSQPAPGRRGGSGASLHALPRGTETVLVVEDEDAVRRIVKTMLESTGYRVIEARNGPEALEAARRHAETIHLVVTDVVMPEMSGRELAEQFSKDHPGVKILYMSGYTDDAIMRHGIVESGVAFLQKPFLPLALACKVREVLDAPG